MRTRSDLVVKNELGRTVRQLGNEIAFLKTEIYLSEVEPRLQTLTALSRFSVRA
jgi:hypothetical protein